MLATASADPRGSAEDAVETLRRYGADATSVPVAPLLSGTDVDRAARDPAHVASIDRASGVFFTGGDQGRITRSLVDGNGRSTPVLAAVWRLFERGGVIAGTSAGAAIMSETMFFEPAEIPVLLARGIERGVDLAPGLGFAGPGLFVDQHVLARGRFARMLVAMRATGDPIGLGIDEDTAAVISNGVVDIAGNSGVVLLDLSRARIDRAPVALTIDGATIGLLAAGDRLDLRTRVVTPASQATRPPRSEACDCMRLDALDHGVLVRALEAVANGDADRVDLLTRSDDSRGTTIDFRLRRTATTRLHEPPAGTFRLPTIVDVALDARPSGEA